MLACAALCGVTSPVPNIRTSCCVACVQGILGAEFPSLYNSFHAKQPPALPPLAVQYYDFAAWQRTRLEGGALRGSIDYWKQNLDRVSTLELPTDRPYPPAGISANGGSVDVSVAPKTAAALRKLTAECGTTLFTTMLAAWKVRVARAACEEPWPHRAVTHCEV